MKQKKIKKFQFRNEKGQLYWLTQRQIINRVKKGEILSSTKKSNVDLISFYEHYSPSLEITENFESKKRKGKKVISKTIKETVTQAINEVKQEEEKEKKKTIKRGKKRELLKEDISNTPCNSVPSRFADSDAFMADLIVEGKIKRKPDATYTLTRLDGTFFETKNKIEFINEYNSEVDILYDVVDLILDSPDKNKISSPQFFTSGYFFLIYNFVIVGCYMNFKETEIKGCPSELFKIYYGLYVQNE